MGVQLEIIFRSIDTYSIESAIVSGRSIYMHSRQMLNILNVKSNFSRTQLNVEDILMPYDSLYEFGEIGTVFPSDPTLKPVLLLGKDTSSLGACPDFHGMNKKDWAERTIGEHAIHLTVESSEPKSGLRWCRTYFLKHGCSLPLISEYVGGEDNDSINGEFEDEDMDQDEEENMYNNHLNNDDISSFKEEEGGQAGATSSSPSNGGVSKTDKYVWRLQQIYIKLKFALITSVACAFQRHIDVLEAGDEIQSTVSSIKGR